jgi:MinD superfamily P-loop ATPase
MGTPMGVVINRCDVGDSRTLEYCEESSIPVLAELPDDLRIAQAYSRGIAGVEAIPDLRETYEGLADAIRSSHRDQTAAATGERRATNRRKNANL